jgi:chemotaxis protein methyltransferase CheR
MQRVGIASPEAFVPLVAQDGAVFDDLMAEVTIGETYFFREAAHFTLLRKTILPEFRKRATKDQKFRAWSAACSTGEETYSVALALREEDVAADVVGTDVSRARLSAARRGEYRAWSFRGVPDATIERYFKRDGDTFVLTPDVRRDVEFRYLNLASDCYPELASGVWGMDLVLCRNVLIYFDRDTTAHVAKSLLASLSDDGWLLLGATDPPLHDFVKCEVVQTAGGLAYRHFKGTSFRSIAGVRRAVPLAAPLEILPVGVPLPVEDARPIHVPTPLPSPPAVASSGMTSAILAEAYASRDYQRATEIADSLVTHGRAAPTDLVVYVRALANSGRLEEAGRACAAALEQYRDFPELHYLHAVLVAQSGQFAESARAAKRAIYLDRAMIVAHLALGGALARSGDAAGALRAFAASERLLSALPADASVPGTDGEPAGRLLEMTRMQAALVTRESAA